MIIIQVNSDDNDQIGSLILINLLPGCLGIFVGFSREGLVDGAFGGVIGFSAGILVGFSFDGFVNGSFGLVMGFSLFEFFIFIIVF